MNYFRISELVRSGSSWTSIFTAILEDAPSGERGRMFLFRELQQYFDVRVETLSMIGGWSYWTAGGYDDETLNAMLSGKLRLLPFPQKI